MEASYSFPFFAFAGTTSLTLIGLASQQNLIREEERNVMIQYYTHFLERIEQKEVQSLAIASAISESPEVVRLLAERKRQKLIQLLQPAHERLRRDFNIAQFYFQIPPGISFLRLHSQEMFDDEIDAYRKTVSDALMYGESSACLERGTTGLGIRGVVPEYYGNEIVGSLDIGLSFGGSFVEEFHRGRDIDIALFDIIDRGDYQLIATTGERTPVALSGVYRYEDGDDTPSVMVAPEQFPDDRTIVFGIVRDCSDNAVALIELSTDRSEIQNMLSQTRNLMLSIGTIGTIISFILTYLVRTFFIKPIKEIVVEAQDIAMERREIGLEPRPSDEVGSLANALNRMLDALKKRHMEFEDYARTLERRVQERTTELLASEEKYRTLVEHVP